MSFSPDFDYLSKEARRDIVLEEGAIGRRRFLMPKNPELRKNLKDLEIAYGTYSKDKPELIGMTLKGSYVKGYAGVKSDIDGYIFIDADRVGEAHKNIIESSALIKKFIAEDFACRMIKKGLAEKKDFSLLVKASLSGQRHINNLEFEFNRGRKEKSIDFDFSAIILSEKIVLQAYKKNRFELFVGLFSYGGRRSGAIKNYRKMVFELLEADPEGEKKWKEIIKNISYFERSASFLEKEADDCKYLYPQTISEAKEVFL
jgi:hypothetical protein